MCVFMSVCKYVSSTSVIYFPLVNMVHYLSPLYVIRTYSLPLQKNVKPMWEDDHNKAGGKWVFSSGMQQPDLWESAVRFASMPL